MSFILQGSSTAFTYTYAQAAPNQVIPVAVAAAVGAAASIDIAMVPKSLGSILAQIPDGGVTGGAKRGSRSIDFQTVRNNVVQVASGTNSVLLTGSNNTVSGSNAALLTGTGSAASNSYSFVLTGDNCTADGNYSGAWGRYANTLGVGKYAWNSGGFSQGGSSQATSMTLRYETTNATPTVISPNAAPPSASYCAAVRATTVQAFRGLVSAYDTGSGDVSTWRIEGCIKRTGASAATTALVGAPTVALIAQDAAAAAWAVGLSANTTLGALAITVTGAAGRTIRWFCLLETCDVGTGGV